MGRPPIPPQLRMLRGTTRPDRPGIEGPPIEACAELPAPPDWLPNAHAANEYRRLGAVLIANGLLTDGNWPLLALAATVFGKLAAASSAGIDIPAALVSQHRALLADLGLSGIGRSPSATTTKPNRFASYGKRPT